LISISIETGNIDSLNFILPFSILPKLRRFGKLTTVKNSLMLIDLKRQANQKLLNSFKIGDSHYYVYLAKFKSHNTGLEYNLTQHSRSKGYHHII
jgi:hypothetical protein